MTHDNDRLDAALPVPPSQTKRLDKPDTPTPIRIALLDEQDFALQLLSILLDSQADMDIIGTAQDKPAGLELIQEQRPDIVLLDIGMSLMDGQPITHLLSEQQIPSKTIILNCREDFPHWEQVLSSGAKGFVWKGAPPGEVRRAIRAVHQGQVHISDRLLGDLLSTHSMNRLSSSSASISLDADAGEPIAALPLPKPSSTQKIGRILLASGLTAIPLAVLGVIVAKVLIPAFQDPTTKAYDSSLGYPALQRILGKQIKVQTVQMQTQSLTEGFSAEGEGVALESVQVSSLITGTVSTVKAAEGQMVQKGQLLFQLDRTPFQEDINSSRSQIAIAQQDLKNLQTFSTDAIKKREEKVDNTQKRINLANVQLNTLQRLAAQGAISNSQIDDQQDIIAQRQTDFIEAKRDLAEYLSTTATTRGEIQTRLATHQQKLQQATRNLDYTSVYSPADGLISQITITPGERVSPDVSLLTVSENLAFKFDVDQTQINAVKVGNPVTVRLVSRPGQSFQGTVTQVNPTVSTIPLSQQKSTQQPQYTYPVWVKVAGLQLTPGLQGYGQFGQPQTRKLLPETAIIHLSAGEGMAMIAVNGKAVVKKIKVGKVFGNQREILSGLTPKDNVILSPQSLEPGDNIAPAAAPISKDRAQ